MGQHLRKHENEIFISSIIHENENFLEFNLHKNKILDQPFVVVKKSRHGIIKKLYSPS